MAADYPWRFVACRALAARPWRRCARPVSYRCTFNFNPIEAVRAEPVEALRGASTSTGSVRTALMLSKANPYQAIAVHDVGGVAEAQRFCAAWRSCSGVP